jgi:phenylacetate-coenzyme A ligase PaaK-like adenylate-forming protein
MDDILPLRQRIFEMLMESQFWPPDQMLAYQRNQLSQLLHHARTQSPFYKTRLDAVFNRSGAIDWGRWHEIPIVTRAELRDNFQEKPTVLPAHRAFPLQSKPRAFPKKQKLPPYLGSIGT